MIIFLLITFLLLLLFGAFITTGKDITSPSFLFIAPFVAASICAFAYSKDWDLQMHLSTFFVLGFGCFLFALICSIVHSTVGVRIRKRGINTSIKSKEVSAYQFVINVKATKVIPIIIFQLLSIFVVSSSMRTAVARYGISGDFVNIMYWFREYHLFSDNEVTLSSLASNMRLASIAFSYIWIYIICNNYVLKQKNKNLILMLLSVLLGIANSVILGARGEAIQIIVAVYIIFCLLKRKYNNWKPDIKFKQIFITGIVAMALLLSFKASGDMLGRNVVANASISAIDEVAKYLGAEIKNLDIYLQQRETWPETFPGSQTFGQMLSWIGYRVGVDWDIEIYLPFQKVNGISLGNVYTAFYAYIMDFGYIGFIILTSLFAFIAQLLYEYISEEKKTQIINFRIILNSYMLFLVIFSFFGERFFAYTMNISLIKYILIWKLMIWYVTNLRIKVYT